MHVSESSSPEIAAGTDGSNEETEIKAPTPKPSELILLPLRNLVLFPDMIMPISVARPMSIAAAQEAVRRELPLGLVLQKDPQIQSPTPDDLYRVGTVADILRYVRGRDGARHIICRGVQRIRIKEHVPGQEYLAARVEYIEESWEPSTELEARVYSLRERTLEALDLLPEAPDEAIQTIKAVESPVDLINLVAGLMDFEPAEKQEVLETVDMRVQLERLSALLARRIEVLRLSQEISRQTKETLDKQQREFVLREQLKTIQRELGQSESPESQAADLEQAIEKANMPPEAEEQARKEVKRLQSIPEASAEYPMVRTYLDWLVELPWSRLSAEEIDIDRAAQVLDEDHYDLEKVKRRILESLAVRTLNPEGKSPLLCFIGPPGVGKTSLGRSIARATGREFVRQSLGGTHDEAEIRGHRRTYVGAMPGNIIQGIRKANTRNPVFMLDEIDKLGAGFHGDPSAALLEVLDPEQNNTFRDRYLGLPFDLSQVMFITTANVADAIPGPLRDRMEIIELPGYTQDEKVQIARRYLVARQRETNGLREEQIEITDNALRRIVRDYTRESGCRNLEREIGSAFRWAAARIAAGRAERVRIEDDDLERILGPRKYESELAMRTSVPGVATGLAWTSSGGDILFIEASRYPGKGKLILTGHLGDVMKESAQAALSLVKARSEELGVEAAVFESNDIHVHVPAGAIPKDGPSAGMAIFVALASLLLEKTVRSDAGMTGEISLRGLVLPVGGIKQKVVGALQAGIREVLLPGRNRKDYEEIPSAVREALRFHWIDHVDQALEIALAPGDRPAGNVGKPEEAPHGIA